MRRGLDTDFLVQVEVSGHARHTAARSKLEEFFDWVITHRLGRKRLLDAMLGATYSSHGVRSIVSTNTRDFAVFGCFEIIIP